jgi:hypothetical protein
MLFLYWEPYSNMISEKVMGACRIFPAHSNQQMHRGHCIGVGSLTGYIEEAMDGPPFIPAFVMVKESFVVPAIFFYLESAGGR